MRMVEILQGGCDWVCFCRASSLFGRRCKKNTFIDLIQEKFETAEPGRIPEGMAVPDAERKLDELRRISYERRTGLFPVDLKLSICQFNYNGILMLI